MHDPRVNVHLIALPRMQAPSANPPLKGTKREADATGPTKGQPFKKQRQGDREPAKIPDELKGLKMKTAEGKPMCWHFNLSKGCNNQTKGGRCKFGYHTCVVSSQSMVQQLVTQHRPRDRMRQTPQVRLLAVIFNRNQAQILKLHAMTSFRFLRK